MYEDVKKTTPLHDLLKREFIRHFEEKRLSATEQRQLSKQVRQAAAFNLRSGHFSELLNGRRKMDGEVAARIAEYFRKKKEDQRALAEELLQASEESCLQDEVDTSALDEELRKLPLILTPKHLADLLHLEEEDVVAAALSGKIPGAVVVQDKPRFPRWVVLSWLKGTSH